MRRGLRAAALSSAWAVLAAVPACRSAEARRIEVETAALGRAIDRVRQAPNQEKAPILTQLEEHACQAPEVCELKALCVHAYQVHLRALAAADRARQLLGTKGGGTLASIQAAQELAQAERDLKIAGELAERCAEEQGNLSRAVKAR